MCKLPDVRRGKEPLSKFLELLNLLGVRRDLLDHIELRREIRHVDQGRNNRHCFRGFDCGLALRTPQGTTVSCVNTLSSGRTLLVQFLERFGVRTEISPLQHSYTTQLQFYSPAKLELALYNTWYNTWYTQVVSEVLADLLRETKQAQVRKNEEFQQEENAKQAKMVPEV